MSYIRTVIVEFGELKAKTIYKLYIYNFFLTF